MPDLTDGASGATTAGDARKAHGYWRTNYAEPVEITTTPTVPVFSVPVFDPVTPEGYDGTPPVYDADPASGAPRILNPDGRLFDARIEYVFAYDEPTEAECRAWSSSVLGVTLPLLLGSFSFEHHRARGAAAGPGVVRLKMDLDGDATGPLDEVTAHDHTVLPGRQMSLAISLPYFGGENMRTNGATPALYLPWEHPASMWLVSAKLFVPDRSAADVLTTGT